MSWGTELWDQYENLSRHTDKGVEFCEKYMHFMKERCAIEVEYAAKLKKLVKNAQPKKKEEDDYQFSHTQGYKAMTKEVFDMAGQHEVIAENLASSVVKELQQLISELKTERKKYLNEYIDLERKLATQKRALENSKKMYEKAFKDAERAHEAFKRADADIYLSRAEVEKAKTISLQKNQQCEDSKNEYASQLQKTNDAQTDHYSTLIPQTLQSLQDMDERRICQIQEYIKSAAHVERSVCPIINTCIDGMTRASDSIDASADSKLVVDKYKSGFQPPADIPFEDLSDSASIGENNANTPTSGHNVKHDTAKGTITGKKKKGKGGLFTLFGKQTLSRGSFRERRLSQVDENKEDFSNLAPNQQKKQLMKKIDGIRQQIAKQTAERDGMVKMRDVYSSNPSLGDPASLDKQLEDNAQELDRLRGEEQKFQAYLSDVENRDTPKSNRKAAHGSRTSLAVDSPAEVSRSSSDLNLHQSASNPGTPYTSIPGTPVSQNAHSNHDVVDGSSAQSSFSQQESFDDLDDFAVLGSCRAIYLFEATNEGSIGMAQEETFSVVEQDQGDGWTRVRRDNGDEGYVPTSYLEIQFY